MQGIYDATRGLLYFTNRGQVNVFSPAMHSWLAPILISSTNSQSRLVGIALSPDANTLAVSDAGNNRIYVLNPSSPTSAKSFFVNTGIDVQPYGLAVTSSGAVYYATHDQNISPPGGFNRFMFFVRSARPVLCRVMDSFKSRHSFYYMLALIIIYM